VSLDNARNLPQTTTESITVTVQYFIYLTYLLSSGSVRFLFAVLRCGTVSLLLIVISTALFCYALSSWLLSLIFTDMLL